jgi:hypothetical protein
VSNTGSFQKSNKSTLPTQFRLSLENFHAANLQLHCPASPASPFPATPKSLSSPKSPSTAQSRHPLPKGAGYCFFRRLRRTSSSIAQPAEVHRLRRTSSCTKFSRRAVDCSSLESPVRAASSVTVGLRIQGRNISGGGWVFGSNKKMGPGSLLGFGSILEPRIFSCIRFRARGCL